MAPLSEPRLNRATKEGGPGAFVAGFAKSLAYDVVRVPDIRSAREQIRDRRFGVSGVEHPKQRHQHAMPLHRMMVELPKQANGNAGGDATGWVECFAKKDLSDRFLEPVCDGDASLQEVDAFAMITHVGHTREVHQRRSFHCGRGAFGLRQGGNKERLEHRVTEI
jgi:hypothetical protein